MEKKWDIWDRYWLCSRNRRASLPSPVQDRAVRGQTPILPGSPSSSAPAGPTQLQTRLNTCCGCGNKPFCLSIGPKLWPACLYFILVVVTGGAGCLVNTSTHWLVDVWVKLDVDQDRRLSQGGVKHSLDIRDINFLPALGACHLLCYLQVWQLKPHTICSHLVGLFLRLQLL